MNRVQFPLRRLADIAAAVLLGLTTVVAVASPASAHKADVVGVPVCDTVQGQWVITWIVRNSQDNKDATLQSVVTSPDTPVAGIEAGSVVPRKLPTSNNGKLQGTQRVPGATTEATLTVAPDWEDHEENGTTYTGTVRPRGTCQPTPRCVSAESAEYEHTFDGPKGTATVRLKGTLPLCQGQSQDFTLVSYFAPRPEFAVPQYVHDSDTGSVTPEASSVTLDVTLPDCFTQVDLIFGGKDEIIDPLDGRKLYGDKLLGSKGAPGNRSSGPHGGWNGGAKSCTQPAAEFVSDCDGSVVVNVSNKGKFAAPFVVTGEDGFTRTVSVEPGRSKPVRVPPAAAGKITVTSEERAVASGGWQRPRDCPLPTVVAKSDCDNFTLTVSNPKGNVPVKATVTYGTQARDIAVAAGGSQVVKFPAGNTKAATVTFAGLDLELEAVYAKPATCGGAGGGGLPVTGAAVGGSIAAATVLLAVGAGLFLAARRRRVRFTT